jgi:hypothetical protein
MFVMICFEVYLLSIRQPWWTLQDCLKVLLLQQLPLGNNRQMEQTPIMSSSSSSCSRQLQFDGTTTTPLPKLGPSPYHFQQQRLATSLPSCKPVQTTYTSANFNGRYRNCGSSQSVLLNVQLKALLTWRREQQQHPQQLQGNIVDNDWMVGESSQKERLQNWATVATAAAVAAFVESFFLLEISQVNSCHEASKQQ